MKKTTIALLLSIFVTGTTEAQTYTLRKCIETGLENNYSLRITRNEE